MTAHSFLAWTGQTPWRAGVSKASTEPGQAVLCSCRLLPILPPWGPASLLSAHAKEGREQQGLLNNLCESQGDPQTGSWGGAGFCLQVFLQVRLGRGRMAFRPGRSPIFTIRCQLYHLHFWFLRHKALPWTRNREYKHTRLLSENTISNCLLFNSYQKPSWEKQYLQKIIWRTSSSSILQTTLHSVHGSNLTTSQLHTRAILLYPHTALPSLDCILMPCCLLFAKSCYKKQSYKICSCIWGTPVVGIRFNP